MSDDHRHVRGKWHHVATAQDGKHYFVRLCMVDGCGYDEQVKTSDPDRLPPPDPDPEHHMKYFIDTEFYEFQPTRTIPYPEHDAYAEANLLGANAIQLISIGIVAEDGREFYAENADFNWDLVPDDHWLQDNVRPHLWGEPQPLERASDIVQPWRNFRRYVSREGGHWHAADIADAIKHFVDPGKDRNRDQFYGWYCDYDWVVFCGLFGRMIDLPEGFPMYMRDLKQAADMIGNPDLSMVKVEGPEHHALTDARDVRAKYLVIDHVYAGFARP